MALYKLVLLISFSGLSVGSMLDIKLELLQERFEQESLKTRSLFRELQTTIKSLNETRNVGTGTAIAAPEQFEKGLQQLDQVAFRLKEQEHRMKVIYKGVAAEKAQIREIVDLLQDLVDNNKDSVLELQMVMGKVRDESMLFQSELNSLRGSITDRIDKVEADNAALKQNFEARLQTQEMKLRELVKNTTESIMSRKTCPANWKGVGGVCFILFDEEPVNWETANKNCKNLGGKLFEPDTREKRQAITRNNVWVGAFDADFNGTWEWESSGKVLTEIPWGNGQPNNVGGNQWCLEIYENFFNDETCEIQNWYACEKNMQ